MCGGGGEQNALTNDEMKAMILALSGKPAPNGNKAALYANLKEWIHKVWGSGASGEQ